MDDHDFTRCHICGLPVRPDARGWLVCPEHGQVFMPGDSDNGQGPVIIEPLDEDQVEAVFGMICYLLTGVPA